MIHEILRERDITPIDPEQFQKTRKEMLDHILNEEYGIPLPPPTSLQFEVIPPSNVNKRFAAGNATLTKIIAHTVVCGKEFSFPFYSLLPNKEGKYPFFVFNNFSDKIPEKYFPAEEIINNGFAAFLLYYDDITNDDGDFTDKLAAIVTPPEAQADPTKRAPNAPGKLAMWAWANMRVLDYAQTLDCCDMRGATVTGHSRLGKTALLTGALDARFQFVAANNSGCSGDAITRGKQGEHIEFITKTFPYWFCENYKKYVDEDKLTFDQHQLIAAVAPRHFMSGAALEDTWADPESQLLACHAASGAWESYGMQGLIAPDRYAIPGEVFDKGNICYHLRAGTHYYSRNDWLVYMDYIKKNMK